MPKPCSGFKILILPSLSSTTSFTIHIPNPVPTSSPVDLFRLVVKSGVIIISGFTISGLNPGPLS